MPRERILRHPNGGALKIGTEVHVSADSYCDAETRLSGMSHVFESSVRAANVESSYLFASAVTHSTVIGSVCSRSIARGVFLEGAVLDRVKTASAQWGGILLKEVVAETCELYGRWELSGNARITTGIWYRPPRFLRITGDGVDFGLTESTNDHAMLGCFRKPLTELLHAGPRLGRKRGWTGEQIRAAKEFYEELADVKLEGVRR